MASRGCLRNKTQDKKKTNRHPTHAEYLEPFVEKLHPIETDSISVCTKDEFQAICDYHIACDTDGKGENTCPVVEILAGIQATAIEAICAASTVTYPETGVSMISAVEWRKIQREDPTIGRVIEIMKGEQRNSNVTDENPVVKRACLLKEPDSYSATESFSDSVSMTVQRSQLVLTGVLRERVLLAGIKPST